MWRFRGVKYWGTRTPALLCLRPWPATKQQSFRPPEPKALCLSLGFTQVVESKERPQGPRGLLLASSVLSRLCALARKPAANTAKTTGPTLPLASAINGEANIQKEIIPQATVNLDNGSRLGLNAPLRCRSEER